MSQRTIGLVSGWQNGCQLFLDPVIRVHEIGGCGDDERVRRCAEGGVGAVDLPAGGPAAEDAEIADLLVVANAVKDEGRARVVARLSALVGQE